jgi:excisionase family DNA binding protein
MQSDTQPLLLTCQQTAKLAQVSEPLIYKLIKERRIRAVRVGRFLRVPKAEALRICEKGTKGKEK